MGIGRDAIDAADKIADTKYQFFKKYWYVFVIVFLIILVSYIMMGNVQ